MIKLTLSQQRTLYHMYFSAEFENLSQMKITKTSDLYNSIFSFEKKCEDFIKHFQPLAIEVAKNEIDIYVNKHKQKYLHLL